MFILLDESKDGYLSPEELRKGMHDVLGSLRAGHDDISSIVEDLDTNGDGKIDF